jgi:hypothetical protein
MKPELARRHPHLSSKDLSEVALVGEPGREGNLREGSIGRRELLASAFNPQPSDVLARAAFVVLAECTGEMHWVDADVRGDLAEFDFAQESVEQEIAGTSKPKRGC